MTQPRKIVEFLTSFPHRGAATEYESGVLDILEEILRPYAPKRELFKTPKTYVSVVWWLVGSLSAGLVLATSWPLPGAILTTFFGCQAILYFNWYPSVITKFPPLTTSHNVVVKGSPNTRRVVLMAHWDTAPISLLYQPNRVGSFRISLIISLLLMALAILLALGQLFFQATWLTYSLWILAAYFVLQGITGTLDFFRLGYSNGASDNATGVAAAIATAERLWAEKLDHVAIDLVITGAEEAGMIGAKAYLEHHRPEFTPENTFLINFDTLGAGSLKVITQTGSLTNIIYKNALTDAAQVCIEQIPAYSHITTGAWHTADFDSVWYQRAGIPSVTLAALDNNGRMPHIHRPEDTLGHVDFKPMEDAIELAVCMVKCL